MSKIRDLISTLSFWLALAALAVVLSWLVGPRGVRPVQQAALVQTPTPVLVDETSTPERIILITPPPTYVPPPTPTPRPWPETTPLPTLALPEDPSGTILYMTFVYTGPIAFSRQCTVHAIQIDKAGQPIGEAKALADIENCGEPFASPDGRYLAVPQGTPMHPTHGASAQGMRSKSWPNSTVSAT